MPSVPNPPPRAHPQAPAPPRERNAAPRAPRRPRAFAGGCDTNQQRVGVMQHSPGMAVPQNADRRPARPTPEPQPRVPNRAHAAPRLTPHPTYPLCRISPPPWLLPRPQRWVIDSAITPALGHRQPCRRNPAWRYDPYVRYHLRGPPQRRSGGTLSNGATGEPGPRGWRSHGGDGATGEARRGEGAGAGAGAGAAAFSGG
jgi:hypothetical protein